MCLNMYPIYIYIAKLTHALVWEIGFRVRPLHRKKIRFDSPLHPLRSFGLEQHCIGFSKSLENHRRRRRRRPLSSVPSMCKEAHVL